MCSVISLRIVNQFLRFPGGKVGQSRVLVSHYSAIGDTISCDAPYSAIGFRDKLLCDTPLVRPVWIAIGHFSEKNWGCSSDSVRYHRKHSATGVLLHLSRDRGGISVGSLTQSFFSLVFGFPW